MIVNDLMQGDYEALGRIFTDLVNLNVNGDLSITETDCENKAERTARRLLKSDSEHYIAHYKARSETNRDNRTSGHQPSREELLDYFAIGQCTPGVIALNVSTFIGYKKKGIIGGITASIGFLTCPIVIILLIAAFLTNFADLPVVKHAFAGIRVCVCVLILQAVLRLWKNSIVDRITMILYILIFLLAISGKFLPVSIPPAILVILSGVAGVILGKEK